MKGLTLIMLLLLLAAVYTGAHHHTEPAKSKYCRVGLLNVGVVNFVATDGECKRIHDAITGREKHEAT